MNCQQFRETIGFYVSDESLIEKNEEVSSHLKNCPPCRSELAADGELRTRLRSAAKNDPQAQINLIFARRLEANLCRIASRPTVLEKLKAATFINSPIWAATAAACLLIGIFFGAVWLRRSPATRDVAVRENQNQPTEPAADIPPNESVQIVQAAWKEMTRKAIGDHENCAVHFHLKEKPIPLDEAAKKYGKFNRNLDKTVAAAVRNIALTETESGKTGDRIEFLDAHSCIYNGQRFAHVILRKGNKTISVLVADTDLPDTNTGQIIAQSEGAMQTASFRAARHAVFVVSDLSERENMLVAQAISPAVRRQIQQNRA